MKLRKGMCLLNSSPKQAGLIRICEINNDENIVIVNIGWVKPGKLESWKLDETLTKIENGELYEIF